MRFLRGLGVGVLMFIMWIFVSIMGALDFIGEHGLDAEFDLALMSPIWSIPLVISFFGMFLGPIYYWIIEPIRKRGKTRVKYTPSSPVGVGKVAGFCQECGQKNPSKQTFCGNCGADLSIY
ncbi:MAG: zinc ribbon domain-containing protein [Candidatus Hodarchaeales archaeon]|jgi:hypothetical protein